jgi:hypothetical protein
MGIRGLASFVSSHGCLVVTDDLRDTVVIIDGLNFAHYFTDHKDSDMRSAFGGDYCGLRDRVQSFVKTLRSKNVTPVVIFDGSMDSYGAKLRALTSSFLFFFLFAFFFLSPFSFLRSEEDHSVLISRTARKRSSPLLFS